METKNSASAAALQRDITQRLQKVAEILPELSTMLCSMQSGELDIKTKSSAIDLVTAADTASEERILQQIRRYFPRDDILAEESGHQSISGDYCWAIDPIDGTINYAHGLPLYCISIGLMHEDKAVGGLVHMPALSDTYMAVLGQGATKNRKTIRTTDETVLKSALVVTGFPYSSATSEDILARILEAMRLIVTNARGLRRTGSAALDLCWTAEGRFDAYYELNLSPWDICAGTLIVREAGGIVTDTRGKEHHPFIRDLMATNGRLHPALLELLAPVL